MTRKIAPFLFAFLMMVASPVMAAPEIGKVAPDFTAVDTKGVTHKLSDLSDRIVILEWTNHECPYVAKQYNSGNMQSVQKQATDKGAVWFTIISSAEGQQGYVTAEQANEIVAAQQSNTHAVILDPTGEIGEAYAAKTTPHMFIINKGILVYDGAIDSDSGFKEDGLVGATNYVLEALQAIEEGRDIDPATTKPYGCSVKY